MKKSLFQVFKYSMFCILLSSCTYTITLIHTEGSATDLIDDTDSPTVTTSIPLNVSGI